MADKSNQTVIRSNDMDIKKASLSALVKRRIYNDREYPAKIHQILDNQIQARLMPPIVRTMRQENEELEIDPSIKVRGSGLKEGDFVLVQRQDDEWIVTTILSEQVYAKRLNSAISERLIVEGLTATPSLVRRAAKRRFESFFAIESAESTPWAVPGRLSGGKTFLSRKILQWCAKEGGSELDRALRRGLPRVEDWGEGPLTFGIYPTDDEQPVFSAVALENDEHQILLEKWGDLLTNPPNKIEKEKPESVVEESNQAPLAVIEKPKRNAVVAQQVIPKKIPEGQDALLIAEEPSIFHPFPHHLAALIDGLRLPMPQQPLTEGMSTLVAWTQADHPSLRERSVDFFMMLLADGDEVRPNPSLRKLWVNWHRTEDPIHRLCTVVQAGEEPAAIRALVGRAAPGPSVASAISDHLLLRWRRFLLRNHDIHEDEEPFSAPYSPPTMVDFRVAMRHRGVRCADIWLDRLLLAALSATELGTVLVFSAPRRIAIPLIATALNDVFEGAQSESIRLPRRRTHLLGRINRDKDIFQLSPLSQSIRSATRTHFLTEKGKLKPYYVMIEDLGQHAKTDAIPALLRQAKDLNGALLYSEEENVRWLAEYEQLHSRDDLDKHEENRRDTLEAFYSAEALGGHPPERAWRLHVPPNMCLMGILDTTRSPKALDLLSNAFVLIVPDLDIDEIQEQMKKRKEKLKGIQLRRPKINTDGTWDRFPRTRDQLFAIVKCLASCNFTLNAELSRQVSTFLAFAETWGVHDSPILTSHLAQTLILPRIRCLGGDAIGPLRDILQIENLAADLQKAISNLINRAIQHRHEIFHGALR